MNKEPPMKDLVCPDCRREEGPPWDIGDECLCGGKFELKKSDGEASIKQEKIQEWPRP
jgi:hypothetical protein